MKRLLPMTAWIFCNTTFASGVDEIDARVVRVEPIREWVTERTPREICRDERIKVINNTRSGSATPALLGAVIGGTVGGAVGHNSRHQPIIAGAGALLGASVGRDYGRQRTPEVYYDTETTCTTEYEVREFQEITGYSVDYEYDGNVFKTRTMHHPGSTIRVRVTLTPLE